MPATPPQQAVRSVANLQVVRPPKGLHSDVTAGEQHLSPCGILLGESVVDPVQRRPLLLGEVRGH